METKEPTYFCEHCGRILIITKTTRGYSIETGEALYQTTWRCPKWRSRLSQHTSLSSGSEDITGALYWRHLSNESANF